MDFMTKLACFVKYMRTGNVQENIKKYSKTSWGGAVSSSGLAVLANSVLLGKKLEY